MHSFCSFAIVDEWIRNTMISTQGLSSVVSFDDIPRITLCIPILLFYKLSKNLKCFVFIHLYFSQELMPITRVGPALLSLCAQSST